jgi:ribosome maturation factor RimP
MTSPTQSTGVAAIGELVEPLVIATGLELWDVEVNPRAVRILVDRPGGVDLEALSTLAKDVSAALDGREDLTPGSQYQLEVSSPGVERTLRTVSHFQRYVGREVSVKTEAPLEGDRSGSRRLQGVLVAADATGITLQLSTGATELRFDQISKARTVLIWGPKPKKAQTQKGQCMKDAAR